MPYATGGDRSDARMTGGLRPWEHRPVTVFGIVSVCFVSLGLLAACHDSEGHTASAGFTRLEGADALSAQAAALRAHLEDSSLPSSGPDGAAQICVSVAATPAGPYDGHIEGSSDPLAVIMAPLRIARPNLRALSQCDSRRAEKDIRLIVGWPVEIGDEVVVAIDRVCWWTCASGYKVRLRRAEGGFEVVAQTPDRWVS
jgi:hypothetical protein